MNWYLDVLKKYAVFSGRARRQEYWMFFLFNCIIVYVVGIVEELTTGNSRVSVVGSSDSGAMGMLFVDSSDAGTMVLLYSLAVLIPSIAVAVRRLHDTNRSGWWFLMILIPLIGWIVLLIFLTQDSKPGQNQYGENPKEAKA